MGTKRDMEKKKLGRECQGIRKFTGIQICVEGYNEKQLIVHYAYRQNSNFHNNK